MDDRAIMENLLLTTKGVCSLYMNGTIESATQNVHSAFDDALAESLTMQGAIYQKMAQKGWYPAQQVEQQKIDDVKNKYAGSMQM
jgi:spore coat protein CotF